VKKYLNIAAQIRSGKQPQIDEPLLAPFTLAKMAAVNKLIYGRKSYRNFLDKPIPGRNAPNYPGSVTGHAHRLQPGAHPVHHPPDARRADLDLVRYPHPQLRCIVLIFHDKRVAVAIGQNESVPPPERRFDAAASNHMRLMAHAGGCWLSERHGPKQDDLARDFQQKYGLPDHIEPDLHVILGYTAIN